jgi:SAM-dependent methyltransferase
MPDQLDAVVDHLVETYPVGPRFARAYLRWWNSNQKPDARVTAAADIETLPDPQKMWFLFAMSANGRGRTFVNRYLDHFDSKTRTYLDVGCGMGGFLVACAEKGFRVRGIEIVDHYIPLARANLIDAGVEPEAAIVADVSSDVGCLEHDAPFGAITANDVLEHVFNLERTLDHVRSLLADDGVFIAEVPNRDDVRSVIADGHFRIFAITQLGRSDAIALHHEHLGTRYRVGEYYSQEVYARLFERAGFQTRFEPLQGDAPITADEFSTHLETIRKRASRCHEITGSADLSAKIRSAVMAYLDAVERLAPKDLEAALCDPHHPFTMRFCCRFWKILSTAR